MSIFADTAELKEGDCALIMRENGGFEIASMFTPAGMMSMAAGRYEQQMAVIVGLYMVTQDDGGYERLHELGTSIEAQRLIAANLPTEQ